jgi:hypothetical protein
MTIREEGPLEGWDGGSLRTDHAVMGWDIKDGRFIVHSAESDGLDPTALVRLSKRMIKLAKSMGFQRAYWQVLPEVTGSQIVPLSFHGRVRVALIELYMDL